MPRAPISRQSLAPESSTQTPPANSLKRDPCLQPNRFDPAQTVGPLNRRLFGSFVEHLGRCVYDGIYEPGHPSTDPDGFRTDVMDLVRELGVTTIRYPGGNFVSGYRWEDGADPRERRPKRLDLAWHSLETNQVGLHEFARWSERVGAELMLARQPRHAGHGRGARPARVHQHPCRLRLGGAAGRQRFARSFQCAHWCLGNELDGPWQLGHRSAEDYGKIASQVAKAMRQMDPNLELVVCGSSNRSMPTFGTWERVVLEHTYHDIDFISGHSYYQERNGDRGSFLASAVDMDAFIEAVIATADSVKAALRSERTIDISFDEWNVWHSDRFNESGKITDVNTWPYAPRLLEDQYSVTDAVVVGSLLISLLKHADRVKAACLAQLVNVIAPIMTEPGGPAWRQTTFFPFAITAPGPARCSAAFRARARDVEVRHCAAASTPSRPSTTTAARSPCSWCIGAGRGDDRVHRCRLARAGPPR